MFVAGRFFAFVTLILKFSAAYGAGFQLGEHSANAIGRSLAGYGVIGDDASAVFFNPAGLVLLDRPTVQNGLFYITSGFEFENQGSRQSLAGLSAPSRGIDDDGGRDGLAPSLYALAPLWERVRVALGITAPFGLVTDYDADWVGRYHALRSELKTIDINPSVAYRLSGQLSLGAGVSVQYADATLSRAVFVFDPASGNPLADGLARVEGDDWSVGYDLGLMFEWDQHTRFGAGYRSKVDHTLRGTRKLEGVPAQSSVIGGEA
ncbi:MAG: OmpP1/FadL family transporter, partial [Gammaproteobacteria bacterium]